MAEFIEKTDTLNKGREKINAAIQDAEDAKNISVEADEKATQALVNSESTQTQLDTIVIEGDSSVEAAQARVDVYNNAYNTLKQRLDTEYIEVMSRLAQIAVNANQFESIQEAIDYVESHGGGQVLVSDVFQTSETTHVKRGVELIFSRNGRIVYTESEGNVLVFHRDSFSKNARIFVPHDYNDSAILVSTPYVYWNRLTRVTGTHVVKEKFNPNTTNCVALEFHASPFQHNGQTLSGYSYVDFNDFYAEGFNTVVKMTTDGNGWITACKLENFKANNFANLIYTDQSEESLGIDSNIFDSWQVQLQSTTREIFLDMNSNNIYKNFKIWDMHANPDAKMGIITGNYISPENPAKKEPMFIASAMYGSRGYRFLGTFHRFAGSSSFAYFTIKGQNLDIDTEISVSLRNNEPTVTRKHYGRTIMNNTRLSFHYKKNDNGTIDLFAKPITDYDVSFYLTDYLLFTGSPESVWYESLTGATEITNNEDIYLSVNPVAKIATNNYQMVEPNTTTLLNINARKIDTVFSFRSGDPGKIYCSQSGVYQLIGKLTLRDVQSGYATMMFRVNDSYYTGEGSELIVQLREGTNVLNATTVIELEKDDYVQLMVRHSNVAPTNVSGELTMIKISD